MLDNFIEKHYADILELFNCLKIGIYITDGEGNTILVNDESCRTGGLSREDVTGRNMTELESDGFVEESVSLKTLKSRQPETMVQNLGDGGKVFVSAQPKFKKRKLQYIVTTERDITEIYVLRELLKEMEVESDKYRKEIEYLKNKNIERVGPVVASDPKSKAVVDQITRIAKLNTTVLLTGESGTGKEVYANLIYKNSSRVGKPFIKVNCAAIPDNLLEAEMFGYDKGAFTGADENGKIGYFELANGGTIFLDEIGDIPIHLQSKLLRVLQEKEIIHVGGNLTIPVDVRVIAATNVDLLKAVEENKFRNDLYYRLAIMPIEILPLRERTDDIADLAYYFAEKFCTQYKINKKLDPSAIQVLERYDWPGNVRELQNIIERSIISFDGYKINHFQIEKLLSSKGNHTDSNLLNADQYSLEVLLERQEKKILLDALSKSRNASEAAKKLKISKSTMTRRMRKYNMDY